MAVSYALAVLVGALGPEPAERRVDHVGVERADGLVAEPDAIHHARSVVLHDHVGLRRQLRHDRDALGLLQVERDRPLAAVAREVQRAHAVDRHADPSTEVADAGPFDLHHVGALVGDERGRVGTGQRDREVEDADAAEWPGAFGHGISRGRRRHATTRPWRRRSRARRAAPRRCARPSVGAVVGTGSSSPCDVEREQQLVGAGLVGAATGSDPGTAGRRRPS